MTTAVVDTNVLASGVAGLNGPTPPARILRHWREGIFELAISSHIMVELRRTLASPYFVARVEPWLRDSFLRQLNELATPVVLLSTVSGVATQAKDDPILATALNSKADYLVTGDKALLDLGTFEATRIVTAAEFVAIIEAS